MRALTPMVAIALVASAAACSKYESLGLSGAGSMRVEVEVYKGPLGQSREIQIGELSAVLAESVRAMNNWTNVASFALTEMAASCGQPGFDRADCQILQDAIESGREIIFEVCQIYPVLVKDAEFTRNGLEMTDACSWPAAPAGAGGGTPKTLTLGDTAVNAGLSIENLATDPDEIARRVATIAASMKSKAFRIADATVHYVPRSLTVRDLLANFGLIASEYSNQIQARTAVLHKQFDTPPQVADTMPVSDYLRDSSQTDFIQLFDWYAATMGDEGWGAPGELGPQERIRMAERLFADYYWEKVNEVYASGQGDVTMAFIKNDIGNWDLKSFSSDPADLLAAYRGAANAALAAVVELAADASTGGAAKIGDAQQLLGLAGQIATGESSAPATAAGLDVNALHARAVAKLESRRNQFAALAQRLLGEQAAAIKSSEEIRNRLPDERGAVGDAQIARDACNDAAAACTEDRISGLDGTLAEARNTLSEDETTLAEAEKTQGAIELRLKELPRDAAVEAREILDDHLAVIAALQEGIAGGAAPTAPGGQSSAVPPPSTGLVPPPPGGLPPISNF